MAASSMARGEQLREEAREGIEDFRVAWSEVRV
jgi:hypothetical protein